MDTRTLLTYHIMLTQRNRVNVLRIKTKYRDQAIKAALEVGTEPIVLFATYAKEAQPM